ncbi:MAG: hypothetical protein IT497_02350 [Ottowia sp.]|nr:hypothetical protein [Ottowia sp.]
MKVTRHTYHSSRSTPVAQRETTSTSNRPQQNLSTFTLAPPSTTHQSHQQAQHVFPIAQQHIGNPSTPYPLTSDIHPKQLHIDPPAYDTLYRKSDNNGGTTWGYTNWPLHYARSPDRTHPLTNIHQDNPLPHVPLNALSPTRNTDYTAHSSTFTPFTQHKTLATNNRLEQRLSTCNLVIPNTTNPSHHQDQHIFPIAQHIGNLPPPRIPYHSTTEIHPKQLHIDPPAYDTLYRKSDHNGGTTWGYTNWPLQYARSPDRTHPLANSHQGIPLPRAPLNPVSPTSEYLINRSDMLSSTENEKYQHMQAPFDNNPQNAALISHLYPNESAFAQAHTYLANDLHTSASHQEYAHPVADNTSYSSYTVPTFDNNPQNAALISHLYPNESASAQAHTYVTDDLHTSASHQEYAHPVADSTGYSSYTAPTFDNNPQNATLISHLYPNESAFAQAHTYLADHHRAPNLSEHYLPNYSAENTPFYQEELSDINLLMPYKEPFTFASPSLFSDETNSALDYALATSPPRANPNPHQIQSYQTNDNIPIAKSNNYVLSNRASIKNKGIEKRRTIEHNKYLKKEILNILSKGERPIVASERYNVAQSTISFWRKQALEHHQEKKGLKSNCKFDRSELLKELKRNPDSLQRELAEKMSVTRGAISSALIKMGIVWKKRHSTTHLL